MKTIAIPLTCAIVMGAQLQSLKAVPWWETSDLSWTSFSALTNINQVYQNSCLFAEVKTGASIDLLAVVSAYNSPSVFYLAESTTNPQFRKLPINSGLTNSVSVNTIATVQWTNNPQDIFFGSNIGLCWYDRSLDSIEPLWWFGWDPLYIADLGNKIIGKIPNWGNQSGWHTFTPAGHTFDLHQGLASGFWADPVTQTYGDFPNRFVLPVYTNLSIMIDAGATPCSYRTNGQLAGYLGNRSDGKSFFVQGVCLYSPPDIVILNTYSADEHDLLIGKLGGTFYPLNIPLSHSGSLSTCYYSQHTRLLIAGNITGNQLYSVVLPGSNTSAPVLSIDKSVTVSWDISNSDRTLEWATGPAGPWSPYVGAFMTNANSIQAVVPSTNTAAFFRLR